MRNWMIRRMAKAIRGIGKAVARYVEGWGAIAAGESLGLSIPACVKCLGVKIWSAFAVGACSVSVCTAIGIVATIALGSITHLMGA